MEARSISSSDKSGDHGPWTVDPGPVLDSGLTHYEEAYKRQLEIHSSVTLGNSNEHIIITEHYPVYTMGRKGAATDAPLPAVLYGIPLIPIERGGGITYHGPGQIVGYPILNLAKRALSIPQYLRKLENALIEALQTIGIHAEYREEHRAGLWVMDKKLVSIGIAVRHWVTFHGFALNVDCGLNPFRIIKPCGLPGDQMTSLRELNCLVSNEKMKEIVVDKLLKTFFASTYADQ